MAHDPTSGRCPGSSRQQPVRGSEQRAGAGRRWIVNRPPVTDAKVARPASRATRLLSCFDAAGA